MEHTRTEEMLPGVSRKNMHILYSDAKSLSVWRGMLIAWDKERRKEKIEGEKKSASSNMKNSSVLVNSGAGFHLDIAETKNWQLSCNWSIATAQVFVLTHIFSLLEAMMVFFVVVTMWCVGIYCKNKQCFDC